MNYPEKNLATFLKANQIDNLRPHNIVYGERTVGGSIFHRTTTTSVDYENFNSDQSNEYLHQCVALVGHECDSVEQHFINNSSVSLNANDMVTDNKYRAPIVRDGKDITTSIREDYSHTSYLFKTWNGNGPRGVYGENHTPFNYFAANSGKIPVNGLEPNKTYDFTNQKLQIEGYTEHDFNYDYDDASKLYHTTISTDLYGQTTTTVTHLVPNIGYSKITNPKNELFNFTIVGSFNTNSKGEADIPVSHQPLPLRIYWQLPEGPFEFIKLKVLGSLNYNLGFIDRTLSSMFYNVRLPDHIYRVKRRIFFEENVSYSMSIRIKTKLGTNNQTADDSTLVKSFQSDSSFNLNVNDLFCANNAYLYTTCRYHPDVYRNIGIPSFQAKFKGKKCYDPRTSNTSYTNNPVLHLYDYLVDSKYGVNVNSTLIDESSFIAAANICDENVTLHSGSTEKRYTCNIVLTADNDHRSNINLILSTFVGTLVYSEGKFKVFAGAWSNPTHSIDESWLNGGIQVKSKESKRELFNAVKGTYLNTDTESEDYNEFPKVSNSTYVAQDNNEELVADLNLLGTEGVERAQRIAKIYLQKHRYSEVITMNCNYKALQLSIMDTVYFSNQILGYTNKTYRVISWEMSENGNGFNITLRHETADVYTWNSGEATIPDSHSMLPVPDYNTVEPPSNINVEESLYSTSVGAGVKVKVNGSFKGSKNAFVRKYQIEYKKINDVGYIVHSRVQNNEFEILDLDSAMYEFRVKAINDYGVSSEYTSLNYEVTGLRNPPSEPQDFSISIINNNANLSWSLSPDLDVRIGGGYILKHNTNTTGYTWANSNPITSQIGGNLTSVTVPLLTGVYLIKSVDSTGNQSTDYSLLNVTVPHLNQLNVVTSQNEHVTFSGNKTGLTVVDNTLRLDGGLLFDDLTGLFDSASGFFDSGGGSSSSNTLTEGMYEFSNIIDLGKVVNSRIKIDNKYTLHNTSLIFDDSVGLFDDATGDFDHLLGNEDIVIVTPYIAVTNDNPNSNPTWSSFRRFYISDFVGRAFKFKIEVKSKNSNYNVYINHLSVTVDMPDVIDSGSVTTLTSGPKTVSFNVDYYNSNPTVTGTIVNGSSGDYVIISNETSTSFAVEVKNSSNNNISKTVAWISKGY